MKEKEFFRHVINWIGLSILMPVMSLANVSRSRWIVWAEASERNGIRRTPDFKILLQIISVFLIINCLISESVFYLSFKYKVINSHPLSSQLQGFILIQRRRCLTQLCSDPLRLQLSSTPSCLVVLRSASMSKQGGHLLGCQPLLQAHSWDYLLAW